MVGTSLTLGKKYMIGKNGKKYKIVNPARERGLHKEREEPT
jgi:hypothetical protein